MTQKQLLEALLNKVADQGAELAIARHNRDIHAKNAAHWQQRAIDLGFQVEKLETRLTGAEYLLQGVVLGEDVKSQTADWINAPFFEKQAVAAVNGTGGEHGE